MKTVVVFGGCGFVGRRVVLRLVEAGYHVIAPTRRRERVKGDLIVLPNTDFVSCDTGDTRAMAKLVGRASIVINLVGILHESRSQTFEDIHVEFVRRLTDVISQADGVQQMIHISSLNAMIGAPSRYLRSKGKGESFVTKLSRTKWTVIRPSVVFGHGDSFIGLFDRLLRLFPVMLVPLADARFQPIWVDDLAEMIVACIHNPRCYSKALAAGGPETLRLLEIVRYLMQVTGRKRPILTCDKGLATMLAAVLEHVPLLPPMLTRDNLDSMSLASTCENSNDAKGLITGKLKPLRDYLMANQMRFNPIATYNEYRHLARRN